MKCPKCTKGPMPFMRFLFMTDPTKVTCSSCGATLVATLRWRRYSQVSSWVSLGFAVLLILNGITYLVFKQFLIPHIFLLLLALGVLAEVFSFARFEYEEANEGTGTASH